MTLTEFLLARIAEVEAVARDAQAVETKYLHFGDTAADALLGLAESEGADTLALLHFGRHRPARVLAECEAKRRIEREHLPVGYRNTATGEADEWCGTCGHVPGAQTGFPCATLRALALPYADHPDYREEWKP